MAKHNFWPVGLVIVTVISLGVIIFIVFSGIGVLLKKNWGVLYNVYACWAGMIFYGILLLFSIVTLFAPDVIGSILGLPPIVMQRQTKSRVIISAAIRAGLIVYFYFHYEKIDEYRDLEG